MYYLIAQYTGTIPAITGGNLANTTCIKDVPDDRLVGLITRLLSDKEKKAVGITVINLSKPCREKPAAPSEPQLRLDKC